MTEHQHKNLSAGIISSITFFGFESLAILIGLSQTQIFIQTAIYIFLFHIFWIAFIFDLHLKHNQAISLSSAKFPSLFRQAVALRFKHFLNWRYSVHFLNYLVLPAITYWAVVILLYLNPFHPQEKQLIIVTSSFALTVAYWYTKRHLSAKLESRFVWFRILSWVKLFSVFLAYSAIYGIVRYFGLSGSAFIYATAAASFLLIYQALFAYGYHTAKLITLSLLGSIVLAVVGYWIYGLWSTEYYSAALVMLCCYNLLWGLIHHSVDHTLNRRIIVEYLVLAILILSIILASHNFHTRII